MGQDERDARSPIAQVDAPDARRRLADAAGDAVLIDVREQWEYRQERAPGATLIPLSEFVQRHAEVPRDREALLICHSGYRSMQAALYLRRQGYERLGNVRGGMEAWEAAGLPVERG